VQTWSAARSRGGLPGAGVVVDAALGRARFELAEGRLNQEGWYQRLDPASRQAHRQLGRRLLSLLLGYLVADSAAPAPSEEARLVGREYERIGRECGLSLGDTVRAYLFFREYLHQSVFDALGASALTPESLKTWRGLLGRVNQFTNEVLVAIVEAQPPGE
jgi:hypothetical protein